MAKNNKQLNVICDYRISKDETLLKEYKFLHNGMDDYYKRDDINYKKREALILELYKNYSKKDKPLIKWLLKEEIKYSKNIADSSVLTTEMCAFMLYKYFDLEDLYELYDAKFSSNFDNSRVLDIELIFGFDKEETKKYLKEKGAKKKMNKEILQTIESYEKKCKDIPNAFKSRKEYINYFETKKMASLLSGFE